MTLPCSVINLIPQQGKMGFEQTLVCAENDVSESLALIRPGNMFLDDGLRLSNIVLIEYLNQLVAAVQGFKERFNQTPPRKGLFVGVQDVVFHRPVHVGDELTIKGCVTEEVGQVSFVQGMIYRGGEQIASLVTKLFGVRTEPELDVLTKDHLASQSAVLPSSRLQEPPAYLSAAMHRKIFTYLHDVIINDDTIAFQITCPEESDVFDGHFPGNPILPGIMLLEIAATALELLSKGPVVIKGIHRMKIGGMVLPNQKVSFTIKINRRNGALPSFSTVCKEGEERDIARFSGDFIEGSDQ